MIQEIKRIPLEGVHNTRDLGGYRAADGKRIRHRSLIRSGELHELTEKDQEILTAEYKLATVVDFRTNVEREEKPDPALPGVTYIPNPILEEAALGITREKSSDNNVVGMVLDQLRENDNAGTQYMEKMYGSLLTNDFSKKQYANFFRILLEQEKGAVLWHCTAGKDRAGTAAALLLEALGVSREQTVADYMKVNEFAAEGINRTVQALVQRTGDARLGEHVRTLFSVRESYINTVFQMIQEGYGSIERYMKEEMGIGADGLQLLRNKYLEAEA